MYNILIFVLILISCFVSASENDSLELADKLLAENKYNDAIVIYEAYAGKGNAHAQYMMGAVYFKGLGVDRDYKTASKWFLEAIKNDSPAAEYCLGLMYEKGLGFAQDYKIAASYYSIAASRMSDMPNVDVEIKNNNQLIKKINKLQQVDYEAVINAQHNLATFYFKGIGVEQNIDLALKWLTISAEKGLPQSQYSLGKMYYEGTGVRQDFQKASRWFEKAADSGLPEAEFCLGELYYVGQGKEHNSEKALELFCKSAKNDFIPAANAAAFILAEKGNNLDEAKKLAEKAVQAKPDIGGYLDTLGWVLYKQGNYSEAIRQLEKAVKLSPNDAEIRSHLAEAYLKLGEKDKAKNQWAKALELKPDNKLKEQIQVKLDALEKAPPPSPLTP